MAFSLLTVVAVELEGNDCNGNCGPLESFSGDSKEREDFIVEDDVAVFFDNALREPISDTKGDVEDVLGEEGKVNEDAAFFFEEVDRISSHFLNEAN